MRLPRGKCQAQWLARPKQMLLAVGDRYEEQIAKDREADAAYR